MIGSPPRAVDTEFVQFERCREEKKSPGSSVLTGRTRLQLTKMLRPFLTDSPTQQVARKVLDASVNSLLEFGPLPVSAAATRPYRIFKFMIDSFFVVTVICLFGWALLLIWILVKFDSPGPALFVQTRIGRDGKRFECYKFRTMFHKTPIAPTHEVSVAAVTRMGRLLRNSKLDELPQIINIIKGDLSLIGPRPCLPVQTELIALRQRFGIDKLTPGLTGLAQVIGVDMRNPVALVRCDSLYLMCQSLQLDLVILFKTLRGSGSGDRVAKAA